MDFDEIIFWVFVAVMDVTLLLSLACVVKAFIL